MDDRDKELDVLLRPLMKSEPTSEQLARWQNSAPKPIWYKRELAQRVLQLTAAALIGFIIGVAFFRNSPEPLANVAQNFDNNATSEMVYIKGN